MHVIQSFYSYKNESTYIFLPLFLISLPNMKRYLLSIILLCIFSQLRCQTIEGIIYDSVTGEALSEVVIYLSGTSIYTLSNNDGYFCLVVGSMINTTLVISHLSYESIIIENPIEYRDKVFYLKEKVNILTEATVFVFGNIYRY